MTAIDPRGIVRTITKVEEDPHGAPTLVTRDCGHVGEMASHFHYKVGSQQHCYQCGVEARATGGRDV